MHTFRAGERKRVGAVGTAHGQWGSTADVPSGRAVRIALHMSSVVQGYHGQLGRKFVRGQKVSHKWNHTGHDVNESERDADDDSARFAMCVRVCV